MSSRVSNNALEIIKGIFHSFSNNDSFTYPFNYYKMITITANFDKRWYQKRIENFLNKLTA